MDFRDFRLRVILRVLLLTASIVVFIYLLQSGIYFLTLGFIGGVIVYQVISIINLLENTNRELIGFLSAIRYDDFTQHFTLQGKGGSFDTLTREFNKTIQQFKNVRAEKEAEYQYLKNIIHHIGIGILSFDREGNVQIMNTAAKRLLRVNRLRNIEKIREYSNELVEQFYQLRTGSKALVRIRTQGEVVQLAVYAIELYLKGEEYKLVTLQNIQSELEDNELEAWQNLIRVLTHEIMNSVAPISSLATTVKGEVDYIIENQEEQVPKEDLEDIGMAVTAIQRRSEALIAFVSDFRNLTHLPEPKLTHIKVAEMFQELKLLLEKECTNHSIQLQVKLDPESLIITADRGQIEQVLINLIKNARQALEEMSAEENKEKMIWLIARQNKQNRPIIVVQDNGPGIDKDAIDRIFIPFFTTKKNGSGIGLSLSRQIMRKHKGTIQVQSSAEAGTAFSLIF